MSNISDIKVINADALKSDGLGCHAGRDQLEGAARAAGKSGVLDQYALDYPKGPHDQPQSMCPAFGSLRVGLRMRRTATVLSGSACCVYGLTFTSHFYGARRSVGYVPFNSESLVTGKLFEDIREAVFKLADPAQYDAVVIINLCVPTASGVPLQLLPKDINGVRIIGIDVPGFGVPTHAEAKDVLAGAMLRYARTEAEQGPVQAPRNGISDKPTVALVGEMFPVDPVGIGAMLEPLGLAAGPVVPTREWRELYAALDCAVVAGGANNQLARPEHGLDAARTFDDHLVGDIEAEIGVDRADIVDARQQIGASPPRRARFLERFVKPHAHLRAVHHAGQFVVLSEPGKVRLAPLLRFDRADDADQTTGGTRADPAPAFFDPVRLARIPADEVFARVILHFADEGERARGDIAADDGGLEIGAGNRRRQASGLEQPCGRRRIRPKKDSGRGIVLEQRLQHGLGRTRALSAGSRPGTAKKRFNALSHVGFAQEYWGDLTADA